MNNKVFLLIISQQILLLQLTILQKLLRSVRAEVSVYIILMNCIKLFLVHSPQSQNPDNVIEVQCRVTLCSIVFYYVHISFPLKNTEKHWNGHRHQAGAQAPAVVAGQQSVRPQLGGVLSCNCELLFNVRIIQFFYVMFDCHSSCLASKSFKPKSRFKVDMISIMICARLGLTAQTG